MLFSTDVTVMQVCFQVFIFIFMRNAFAAKKISQRKNERKIKFARMGSAANFFCENTLMIFFSSHH
jgi:hypothetical protein